MLQGGNYLLSVKMTNNIMIMPEHGTVTLKSLCFNGSLEYWTERQEGRQV